MLTVWGTDLLLERVLGRVQTLPTTDKVFEDSLLGRQRCEDGEVFHVVSDGE